ncbi:prominin-1-A-like [Mya arenaria]|uniref:prominin-1-A-like n=1 Tax=Mya arenaria TaxID=6604 RepID=UPI0022DF539A|nr:prominin-1-A-like [Mya arenaria]
MYGASLDGDNLPDIIAEEEFPNKVLDFELPLLIGAGLGIIATLLLVPITLCVCCCRCCGRCGGSITSADIGKHKKACQIANGVILLACIGIVGAMAFCVPMSVDRLTGSPGIVLESVEASIEDVITFLHMFLKDITAVVLHNANSTTEDVKTRILSLPESLAGAVLLDTDAHITDINTTVQDFISVLSDISKMVPSVNMSVVNVLGHSLALVSGLDALDNDLQTLYNQCQTDGHSFCDDLPQGGEQSLDVPTQELEDVVDILQTLVDEAEDADLQQIVNTTSSIFSLLPEMIRNSSGDALSSAVSTLDTVPDELDGMVVDILHNFNFSSSDIGLENMLEPVKDGVDLIEDFKPKVFLGSAVLGGWLGVLCVMVLVGLVLGFLCTRPFVTMARHGRSKAGHCGSTCIMCSVYIGCLPVFLALLLGSVLLVVGGNLAVICQPIADYTVFHKMVDSGWLTGGQPLGTMILDTDEFNISTYDIIKECRAGGTLLSTVNLSSVLDIVDTYNISKYLPSIGPDLVSQVNDSVQDLVTFDISQLTSLTANLTIQQGKNDSIQEVVSALDTADLPGLADNLTSLADNLTHQDYKSAYEALALNVTFLHTSQEGPLRTQLATLESLLDDVELALTSMKEDVTRLTGSVENITNYITTEAASSIGQALDEFLENLTDIPMAFAKDLLNTVQSEVGECSILADIYDTVTGSICHHFLNAFSVFWGSLYVAGLVSVVMMIASCCITKYFRVPSDERRVRIAANTATPISGSPGADVVLTKYRLRNDNNNTTTNNNCSAENTPPIFPKSQCQVLWEKWHRQHRYITGPFSAGFFHMQELEEKLRAGRQTPSRRDVSLDLDLLLAKMEDEPRRGTDQLHKDHADTAQDPVGSDEGIYKDHVEEVPDRTPVVKAELIKLRNEEKAAETTVKGNSNANQHLQGTDIIGVRSDTNCIVSVNNLGNTSPEIAAKQHQSQLDSASVTGLKSFSFNTTYDVTCITNTKDLPEFAKRKFENDKHENIDAVHEDANNSGLSHLGNLESDEEHEKERTAAIPSGLFNTKEYMYTRPRISCALCRKHGQSSEITGANGYFGIRKSLENPLGNFYVANESLNLNNNSLDDHDICENCSGPDLGQESEVCKRKMKEVRQTRSVPLKIQVCPYPGQVRARSPRAAALYRRYIEAHCDPVHMKVAETTGMESHGGKRYSDTVRDNEAQTLPVNEKEFKLSKKFQSLELQRESSSKNEKKVYRGDLISYLNTSAIPDRDTSSFSTHLGRDDNQNQQACSTINSDNVCLVTSGSTLDSVGEPRFPSPRSLALLSAEAVLRPTIETRHTRNPTAAAMCMDKTQVTYM